MRVTFRKQDNGQCSWEAIRGQRTRITCAAMGGLVRPDDLPHDLAQFVAEDQLGLAHGFWGLVAAGATFKSTNRKRTRTGRQVIADHRRELNDAEGAANALVTAWRTGTLSTADAVAFDDIMRRWRALPSGGELTLEWAPVRLNRRSQSSSR